MTKKINITSGVVEKGIDVAKDFLDKLIIPAVEETGLLLKDKVTLWKFKNQVKVLNKAKAYCIKNGISTKTISLKLLCPLLDNAALEEEDLLQDTWAVLLSNMVDSEQNIDNHVFPYILGQISINEFLFLENVNSDRLKRIEKLTAEFLEFSAERPAIEQKISAEIKDVESEIEVEKEKTSYLSTEIWKLQNKKRELEGKLNSLKYKQRGYENRIASSQSIPEDELREFELSNLTRLGLIKYVQEIYANPMTLEIQNDADRDYLTTDLEIDMESENEYVLTELGELFIGACTEKSKTKE